jgi:DNA-binding XRE family transcriptional regulator
LKEKIEASGLSISSAARAMGLSQQGLYMLAAEQVTPMLGTALVIARFFGCKVEDIWQLEEE